MITALFLFLVPKFFAGLYAGCALGIFYGMHKKKRIYPWIYFALGIAGYGILNSLTWGWLQGFEAVMMAACCVGMIVAQGIQGVKDSKELKYNKARQRVALDTIAQIDAFQARWVRDEVTNEEYETFMRKMREKCLPYLRQEEAMIMRKDP